MCSSASEVRPVGGANDFKGLTRSPGWRRRFWRVRRNRIGDEGSATVEFVIWFVFIAGVISVVTDLFFVFTANASMWDAARDGARRLALGERTPAEVELLVKDKLMFGDLESYTVATVDTGTDVEVSVVAPIQSVTVFGAYSTFFDGDITARVTMMKEP